MAFIETHLTQLHFGTQELPAGLSLSISDKSSLSTTDRLYILVKICPCLILVLLSSLQLDPVCYMRSLGPGPGYGSANPGSITNTLGLAGTRPISLLRFLLPIDLDFSFQTGMWFIPFQFFRKTYSWTRTESVPDLSLCPSHWDSLGPGCMSGFPPSQPHRCIGHAYVHHYNLLHGAKPQSWSEPPDNMGSITE